MTARPLDALASAAGIAACVADAQVARAEARESAARCRLAEIEAMIAAGGVIRDGADLLALSGWRARLAADRRAALAACEEAAAGLDRARRHAAKARARADLAEDLAADALSAERRALGKRRRKALGSRPSPSTLAGDTKDGRTRDDACMRAGVFAGASGQEPFTRGEAEGREPRRAP